MRPIKFRAKEISTGTWLIGSLEPKGNEVSLAVFWACFRTKRLDVATLGQYAGLPDKNDVEIYEGDIVRYQRNSAGYEINKEYATREVAFERGAFILKETFAILWATGNGCTAEGKLTGVEVIANKHENPELLRGE